MSEITKTPIDVGDVIILNEVECPEARMLVVVVGRKKNGYFQCKYLNAEKMFSSYNRPPMLSKLMNATRIEDFGVVLECNDSGCYSCRVVSESIATYRDGKPRRWQEHRQKTYRYRKDVFGKIRLKEAKQ